MEKSSAVTRSNFEPMTCSSYTRPLWQFCGQKRWSAAINKRCFQLAVNPDQIPKYQSAAGFLVGLLDAGQASVHTDRMLTIFSPLVYQPEGWVHHRSFYFI